MINKRWITLPVVYSRPFTSKAVFWAISKEFEFAVDCSGTVNGEAPSRTISSDMWRVLKIFRLGSCTRLIKPATQTIDLIGCSSMFGSEALATGVCHVSGNEWFITTHTRSACVLFRAMNDSYTHTPVASASEPNKREQPIMSIVWVARWFNSTSTGTKSKDF